MFQNTRKRRVLRQALLLPVTCKILTLTGLTPIGFRELSLRNLIYNSQQDAHVTEFILSDDCSTCFGYHYHPSSGTQNSCNYSIC
jgi:hypothetical protein